MLRGEKNNCLGFLVFLFICINKAVSPGTIWGTWPRPFGLWSVVGWRVMVTFGRVLKVQVVKTGRSLLPMAFNRKAEKLSRTRDPKVEFQHGLCGNGLSTLGWISPNSTEGNRVKGWERIAQAEDSFLVQESRFLPHSNFVVKNKEHQHSSRRTIDCHRGYYSLQ